MKTRTFLRLAQMVVLSLTATVCANSQDSRPSKIAGTINDYTTLSPGAQIWEMRGHWSVKLNRDGTADFIAELNMEHSDAAMLNGATSRTPHTHHITLIGAQLSDAGTCPTASAPYSPTTTTGFSLTGLATITGNGTTAPFAKPPGPPQSLLTVCVTGSDLVEFSNITLQFPALLSDNQTKNPAAGHFGSQPINGVVVREKEHRDRDDR